MVRITLMLVRSSLQGAWKGWEEIQGNMYAFELLQLGSKARGEIATNHFLMSQGNSILKTNQRQKSMQNLKKKILMDMHGESWRKCRMKKMQWRDSLKVRETTSA